MAATGRHSMWRCAEDFDECDQRRRASALDDADSNALARDGEGNADAASVGCCDAVAVGRERVDIHVDELTGLRNAVASLPAGARSAEAGQLTLRSSTSKTSVAFGGIKPPAPCAP
jgi:hypothetical protein